MKTRSLFGLNGRIMLCWLFAVFDSDIVCGSPFPKTEKLKKNIAFFCFNSQVKRDLAFELTSVLLDWRFCSAILLQ